MNKVIPAFLLTALVCLSGVSCTKKNKTEDDQTKKIKKVTVAPVVRDSVQLTQEFSANIEAYVVNNIAPQTPNRISRILVEVGDNVRKGQLLAILDDASMQQRKLQLQQMESEFKRIDELYEIGGISKSQWENQKTMLEVNRSAYANLAQNTLLSSPTSGVVTARNYDSGDMYNPALPILVIEQIAPLKMHTNISAKYFNIIRKGMPASVVVDIMPDKTFQGKVALTYPTIDSRTHTFETEISLPNEDHRLRPGMYAKATLDLGKQSVLLIPDAAVMTLTGTDDKYTFVLKNGVASYREIEVGKLYGDRFEVLSGVEEGEQVVTAGMVSIKDGDKVTLN